jgi:hypothetical protein
MTAVIYRGDRSGTGFFHRTVQYWLDKTEVAVLVQEAVGSADWSRPNAEGRDGRVRTVRTEIMLAVLTYCYALGMSRATEIEAAIASGIVKIGVVDGAPLDRFALIHFRRHNRDLLTECLTKVLERLQALPAGRGEAVAVASERAAAQARDRIDRAIEADCLDRDA